MATTELMPVEFAGATLYIINNENQPYVPMRPIVEGIGLAWQSQLEKLKGNERRFCITEIVTQMPGDDQTRSVSCIPLRKLPGWMMTIYPNKVKDVAVREKVIAYQNECDDVLWDYWNKSNAQLPSNPRQLPSEYISPAQKQHLKELVDIIVASGKQDYPSTWARFQRKFKVNKYEFLSPTQFDDAVAYLQGKMDGQSMAALVQKHFPDATKMVAAPAQAERDFSIVSLKNKRFFHIFDHEGREHIQRVPNDAMMLNFDEMPYSIKNGLPSMAQLVGIVNAGVEAMAKRSGFGKADPMPA